MSVTAANEKGAKQFAQKFNVRHVPFHNLYDTLADVIVLAEPGDSNRARQGRHQRRLFPQDDGRDGSLGDARRHADSRGSPRPRMQSRRAVRRLPRCAGRPIRVADRPSHFLQRCGTTCWPTSHETFDDDDSTHSMDVPDLQTSLRDSRDGADAFPVSAMPAGGRSSRITRGRRRTACRGRRRVRTTSSRIRPSPRLAAIQLEVAEEAARGPSVATPVLRHAEATSNTLRTIALVYTVLAGLAVVVAFAGLLYGLHAAFALPATHDRAVLIFRIDRGLWRRTHRGADFLYLPRGNPHPARYRGKYEAAIIHAPTCVRRR